MGYYFQCTFCNHIEQVDSFDVIDAKLELNCKDCGEDLCPKCIKEGRCPSCQEDWRFDVEEEAKN